MVKLFLNKYRTPGLQKKLEIAVDPEWFISDPDPISPESGIGSDRILVHNTKSRPVHYFF
jgi:hypothetical protein